MAARSKPRAAAWRRLCGNSLESAGRSRGSQVLLFKKKFLQAIRTGSKTQTIRVWKQRYVRAGQISYTPGIGRIRITAVEEVALKELNDEDARPDGFESAEELRREICSLYAERLERGYRVFKIGFEVAEDASGAGATEG